MRKSLYDHCAEQGDDTLLKQWHPTKNGSLTPRDMTTGSHREVWWRCKKGHEWHAMVKTRVEGTGCPVCANRVVISGENDLGTMYPDLAAQWHPTRNGTLTPRDVVPGTLRKVWWQCEKGHEWQAAVASRVNGMGCPVCAGKVVIPGENDLAAFYPDIAKEWHPTKNGILTPEMVSPHSNKKVWWRCALGHEYPAMIGLRTQRGNGCPYCAGRKALPGFNDLAIMEPEIAKQWHPTLNGALTPEMVTTGSHRKVWWECPNGHVWKAVIHSRTGGAKSGCPICAGRVNDSRVKKYTAILRDQRGETPLLSKNIQRSERK